MVQLETKNKVILDSTKRHNAILLFDATDSNPNGDPDKLNMPRQDDIDNCGLVTGVSMKRKIRDYIDYLQSINNIPAETNQILVRKNAVINQAIADTKKDLGKKSTETERGLAMHKKYIDLRLFGGVLSTGDKAGTWTGPFQISMMRSLHPVQVYEATITRCAVADGKEGKENKTMGDVKLLRYGLYQGTVSYSPQVAHGVLEDDMKLFWEGLVNSWEFTKSACRTNVNWRGIWVFSHEHPLGNCNEVELVERLSVKWDVEYPGKFSDFNVKLNDKGLPKGIVLTKLV